MAADPLKEVLLKVVSERREQIEKLSLQLKVTTDPVVQSELQQKITELQREQGVAQQALGKTLQPEQPTLDTSPAPVPVQPDSSQLLGGIPEAAAAPKGPNRAALEAQIKELQVQLLEVSSRVEKAGLNPDPRDVAQLEKIREGLQGALQQISGPDIQIELGELPPAPTPAQLSEAENLIRRSALEKRRGNKQLSTDLLRKAAEVAPGSLTVQEALGDDLMERGQVKPAAEVYARALAMSPSHGGIERKYATAISQIQAPMSFEQAMQMGDGPLATADAASVKAAAFFSFLIPGVGQLVLGRYVMGASYLVSWLLMIIWISLMKPDLQNFIKSISGRHASYDPLVLVPLVAAFGIAIAAMLTCKSVTANTGSIRKQKGHHPVPPVDLPFD